MSIIQLKIIVIQRDEEVIDRLLYLHEISQTDELTYKDAFITNIFETWQSMCPSMMTQHNTYLHKPKQ